MHIHVGTGNVARTSVTGPIRSAEFAAELFCYDTDFSMWY